MEVEPLSVIGGALKVENIETGENIFIETDFGEYNDCNNVIEEILNKLMYYYEDLDLDKCRSEMTIYINRPCDYSPSMELTQIYLRLLKNIHASVRFNIKHEYLKA